MLEEITDFGPFEWKDKVWGKTKKIISTVQYALHLLKIEGGGFCSFHYHKHRANRFSIKSGVVRIVWCYAWEVESVILSPQNIFVVNSLIPHQFQVLESGEMMEEYWPDRGGSVNDDDIVRLTKGDKIDDIDHIRDTVGILKHDGTFWEGDQ